VIRACSALAVALLGGCAGSAAVSNPAGEAAEVPVLRQAVHAQCPLAVAHPSASWLRTRQAWSEMLAQALIVPPPYDPAGTDFERESVVVIALPRTPTPSTQVQLPASRAATVEAASATLRITLAVVPEPRNAGQARALALGTPCVVMWLPALPNVRQLAAHDTEGRPIAAP
jgi:hypothetical protein